LDRFGRTLRHLVVAIEELTAAGVAFVSLGESIDTTSPTGRLLLGVLGSFAEFERARIRERIMAGLHRAKAQGRRLGRPTAVVPVDRVQHVSHLPVDQAADALGVSRSTVKRWRYRVQQSLSA
jgi:DNA invertase Pin-like site-specific DNA recombinase